MKCRRDLTASDRRHEFFQVRYLSDVRRLIYKAPYMYRKSPAVNIICLFTEQIEKLGVHHTDQEIEGSAASITFGTAALISFDCERTLAAFVSLRSV